LKAYIEKWHKGEVPLAIARMGFPPFAF
jgi:hypothetical protein